MTRSRHSKKSKRRDDLVLRREVAAIRRLKKRAASHGKAFLADIIEIGKRLSRVKDRVGHGNWLPWVRDNFGWTDQTASNYMNVFELSKTAEFLRLRNLPLEALYLVARRNVTPEARIAIRERVEAGEKITPKQARLAIRAPQERVTIPPSPSQERRELNLPPPSAPPQPSDKLPKLTAEYFEAVGRRNSVDLIVDVASRLPHDQSFEEARAVVESVGDAGGMRERFSKAVAMLYDFVGQLQRALTEQQIDEVPARPPFRVVPGKDD